jgi:hypothetical protein
MFGQICACLALCARKGYCVPRSKMACLAQFEQESQQRIQKKKKSMKQQEQHASLQVHDETPQNNKITC